MIKKLINIIILFAIIIFSLESISYGYKYYFSQQNKFAVLAIISFLISFFFIFAIQQRIEVKKNLAILTISFIFSIFIVESLLGYLFGEFNKEKLYSKHLGDIDKKLPIEFIIETKNGGEKIYGLPKRNLKIIINDKEILPLNAVANAKTFFCHDKGKFFTYISDEYGFNNPQGTWNNFEDFYISFIGDSFTQGVCVDRYDNFSELTRKIFPNLLNLGIMDTGPLIQLATIREYLPNETEYVFWSYYEGNDLKDLEREKEETFLMKYLDKSFMQNLVKNQPAINKILIEYLDKNYQEKLEVYKKRNNFSNLILRNFQNPSLLFPNINNLIDRYLSLLQDTFDLNLYYKVLKQGKEDVERRGGKLVLIYLPEFYRYNKQVSPAAKIKTQILEMARSLDIDIIDIDDVFSKNKDPLDYFPFRSYGHYNEKGYKVVADEISNYLNNKKNNFSDVN